MRRKFDDFLVIRLEVIDLFGPPSIPVRASGDPGCLPGPDAEDGDIGVASILASTLSRLILLKLS